MKKRKFGRNRDWVQPCLTHNTLSLLLTISALGSCLGLITLQAVPPGTVFAWGLYPDAVTNVPAGLTNVTAIAAGPGHALALNANGTVVAWGHNDFGQTNVPPGLSNVIAIAAGQDHSSRPGP
jgi:hypothetical protein